MRMYSYLTTQIISYTLAYNFELRMRMFESGNLTRISRRNNRKQMLDGEICIMGSAIICNFHELLIIGVIKSRFLSRGDMHHAWTR
jgi:hypothetical protein